MEVVRLSSATTNLNLIKPSYGESADIGVYNDNMDIIDEAVSGKAAKGDAIKNITRNGTTFTATKADNTTFTFTQQDTTYGNATTSAAGLMSSSDKTKLNGIADGANNYSLPLAASGTRGGAQLGYSTNGKNYAVQQSSEKLYVNVPWTDTWRGIQNNLTSTSTTDSLSAAQGKALNDAKQSKLKTGSVVGDIIQGRLTTSISNAHIIYATASNGAVVVPYKAGDSYWRFIFLKPYSSDGRVTMVTAANDITVNFVYFE